VTPSESSTATCRWKFYQRGLRVVGGLSLEDSDIRAQRFRTDRLPGVVIWQRRR
jgi:hypothetical protein